MKQLRTCIIQLGRYGDILNILPLARWLSEREGKPAFMAASAFTSIAESVSYADFVEWKEAHQDRDSCAGWAQVMYERVLVPQLLDRDRLRTNPGNGRSFCESAYVACGYGGHFKDGEFDKIVIEAVKRSAKLLRSKR